MSFHEGKAAIPIRGEDDNERETLRDTLTEIGGNMRASTHYLSLARDLDVMEPKLPDEVSLLSDSTCCACQFDEINCAGSVLCSNCCALYRTGDHPKEGMMISRCIAI